MYGCKSILFYERMRMTFYWLKPKGFWGYFGVALSLTLIAASAAQMIWHPFVVLSAAEMSEAQEMFQQLYMTALFFKQQCGSL